ncbi:alpha/beta hydrolase family protein [Marinicella litoralis]|uniref:Dipeptidyl aminopeptidase/acylaminoacyl peptidase n=1 Tax=Marinicella litoralis TaxID=644220 RepID=A0A4R6XXH3_9GAMM|nr:alpha/beta fold hydrolase [Marinicella litoralis]TDR23299.1 dipeptidyl aminopeptidase/acylaminoacyl peptidase [Marinicella litoralis]
MLKILTISWFLIACSHQVTAANINTETFFKNPDLTSIKISPDGKHFAATIETDGTKKLAILDINATKIKHIFNFSSDKKEIGNYGWLNNERIFAAMVQKVGPLAQPRATGYLFAGNINGKKTIQLLPSKSKRIGGARDYQRGYEILNRLPNDDKHILISHVDNTYTYAYKLNVYTGKKKVVDKSPEKYARLYADHTGNPKISTSFNEDRSLFKIHIKATPEGEWELFKEFDEKNIQMEVYDFSADNKNLIYFDGAANKETGIYSLDLNSKESTFIHPVKGDAEVLSHLYDFNYDSPEIIGFTRMPGYVETEFFDPQHPVAKIYRSLFNSFQGQVVNIVNTSRDGKLAVIRVWSDYNPGNHYLMDMNSNKVTPLFKTLPWIDRKQMASMQPIEFVARDGLEIRGYLTQPMNQPEGKLSPMVLMVHGGPYGVTDSWGYNPEVQFLSHHGYSVLQVNYRGSGGRGADFQYDHYRQMGKEMQHDLTDATLWAVEQGHASKENICIYGASYGGYAALMGVAQEPDLYQCAVGYVGLYDIQLTRKSDIVQSESGQRFLDEAWNRDDTDFVKQRSPIYHVDKIKAAVMLVHGGKDPRVVVDNYHDMSKALDQAGINHEKMLKPYEGHGFYDLDNKIELYDKVQAFFDQHIGQAQ